MEHYLTRRRADIYKLAMVSSVDRDNSFEILGQDFKVISATLLALEVNSRGSKVADKHPFEIFRREPLHSALRLSNQWSEGDILL